MSEYPTVYNKNNDEDTSGLGINLEDDMDEHSQLHSEYADADEEAPNEKSVATVSK